MCSRRRISGKLIEWLRDVRGYRWFTVYSMCACIYQLTQTGHQPFTGKAEEYTWFQDLLKRIPREPKDLLRQRKIAKIVPYRVFTQIARGMEKELRVNKDLTPIRRAMLYRDYFCCKTIARHPLRGRNWRECPIRPDSQPNLDYDTIPRRVQRDGKLPSWVRKLLAVNPDQKFWRCHFVELETKAKNEIWEFFEPEIVEVSLEYRDVHRKTLLGERADPGTLLINNAGKPMADGQLGAHLGVAVAAKQERVRLSERTLSGLARARSQGRVGGRPRVLCDVLELQTLRGSGKSLSSIATSCRLSKRTVARLLAQA